MKIGLSFQTQPKIATQAEIAVLASMSTTVALWLSVDGRRLALRWYGRTSSNAVRRAAQGKLSSPLVVLGDGNPFLVSGSVNILDEQQQVLDSQRIENGGLLVSQARGNFDQKICLAAGSWSIDDWNDPNFQSTLLSIERIRSHLANERNFLAWTRAALTLGSQGMAIWKLYAENRPKICWLALGLWFTALAYFIAVPGTILLGLHRWQSTKTVLLARDPVEVHDHFGRLGVKAQGANTGAICALVGLAFFFIGIQDDI